MSISQIDPESVENNPLIEQQWALKAIHHANTYYRLICSVNSRHIKMTL